MKTETNSNKDLQPTNENHGSRYSRLKQKRKTLREILNQKYSKYRMFRQYNPGIVSEQNQGEHK